MSFNLEVKYYNSFWLKQVTSPKIDDTASSNDVYSKVFPGVQGLYYTTNKFPNFPD